MKQKNIESMLLSMEKKWPIEAIDPVGYPCQFRIADVVKWFKNNVKFKNILEFYDEANSDERFHRINIYFKIGNTVFHTRLKLQDDKKCEMYPFRVCENGYVPHSKAIDLMILAEYIYGNNSYGVKL